MAYKAWKAGYTLYAPNKNVIWHLWDRTYRPKFYDDARKFSEEKQKELAGNKQLFSFDNKVQGEIIRKIMYADKEYRNHMDQKWGIDLLGRQANQKIVDAGIDSYYFWEFDDGSHYEYHDLKLVK